MNGFEKVSEFMENMQDTANKYVEYQRVEPENIVYHEITDERQLELVKKAVNKSSFVVIAVLIAFLATGIYSICTGGILAGGMLLVFTALLVYFFIPGVISKPVVKEGKAIWKQTRRSGTDNNRKNKYTYYVTIIFEEPSKMLCQLIQTNKEDYEKIEEGTSVLLIKKGNLFYACVDE
mgnify:CR=1 FL=1